jgi:dihydropteroate synthase
VAGIMNGAKIVRVHDVKEVKRAVKITEKILASA